MLLAKALKNKIFQLFKIAKAGFYYSIRYGTRSSILSIKHLQLSVEFDGWKKFTLCAGIALPEVTSVTTTTRW